MSRRRNTREFGLWLLRIGVAVLCLLPFYWLANLSLSEPTAVDRIPADYFPNPVVGSNFAEVLDSRQFPWSIWNSFAVASLTTLVTLGLGAPAAYALARLRVKRKNLVMAIFLGIAIFPAIGMVGPLYVAMTRLGLINRYPALVLPYTLTSLPLAVWILTHYFSTLPSSLEDAALVDGCSPGEAFLRVILPVSAPGLFTSAALIFMFAWNEFLFALIMTSTERSRTVPVALALFAGLHEQPVSTIAAATIISTIPVLLLVAVFQRQIVEGLTAGTQK